VNDILVNVFPVKFLVLGIFVLFGNLHDDGSADLRQASHEFASAELYSFEKFLG
jgi:hypothetical protein